MRNVDTYRSSRRNQVIRTDHTVWSRNDYKDKDIVILYRPKIAKGSAAMRENGKTVPSIRVPSLRYPTNGPREVARRLRKTVI